MTNKTILFISVVLNQGIVYLKCLYLRNCLLYCTVYTGTFEYVHVKKLSLRAAVVANRSITASMLGVSDRWICSIIRHSRRFSSIEAVKAV